MRSWWAERAWLGGLTTAEGVHLAEEGGVLVTVDAGVPSPPAASRRLEGLTLPGLANAHSHAFHRALRSRAQDATGSFWSWRDLMYEVAARLDPDSYLALARAVYAEMALAGYTAVGEFHYLHHSPGGAPYSEPNAMGSALLEAAGGAGVRLTLLDCLYLEGGFGEPLQGVQLRFGDGDAAAWAERVGSLRAGPRAQVGAAVHSVRAVPPPAAAEVAAWAAAGSRQLHAHVSEQRREHEQCLGRYGTTPLRLLAEAGASGPSFTAVHATHCDERDLQLLATTGTICCACPTTERDLGDGLGPFAEMHSREVRLCTGSDSHAVVDGFEEARALEGAARLSRERRALIRPDRLMESTCREGMVSLGWDSGVLEPGRLADFVTVSLDGVRTAGCDRTKVATPVFAATASDVVTVVVGGETIVDEGRHLLVADPARELRECIGPLFT